MWWILGILFSLLGYYAVDLALDLLYPEAVAEYFAQVTFHDQDFAISSVGNLAFPLQDSVVVQYVLLQHQDRYRVILPSVQKPVILQSSQSHDSDFSRRDDHCYYYHSEKKTATIQLLGN